MMKRRCQWVNLESQAYVDYHDREWGVPVHDEARLFEMLLLEGAQAGLSWQTVLNRRESYRKAFDGFDFEKVAAYGRAHEARLLGDVGIIRNKLKVRSAINNARRFLEVRGEFGSFDRYLWRFVDYKPVVNRFQSQDQVPAQTVLSERISKDLKKRGFSFVGPTIVYAFMQAVGMVNDHTLDCFRHRELCRAG